jgi:hypothetical protein
MESFTDESSLKALNSWSKCKVGNDQSEISWQVVRKKGEYMTKNAQKSIGLGTLKIM